MKTLKLLLLSFLVSGIGAFELSNSYVFLHRLLNKPDPVGGYEPIAYGAQLTYLLIIITLVLVILLFRYLRTAKKAALYRVEIAFVVEIIILLLWSITQLDRQL